MGTFIAVLLSYGVFHFTCIQFVYIGEIYQFVCIGKHVNTLKISFATNRHVLSWLLSNHIVTLPPEP